MISEKERTQFVGKLFLAILITVLITVYNSLYYNELISFDTKYLKIMAINKTETHAENVTAKPYLNVTKLTIKPIPKGYLVWNENCHMASMDPFAPHYQRSYEAQLRKHFDVGPNCSEKQPLVTKFFNKTIKSYILRINMSVQDQYKINSTVEDIECCYHKIVWNGDKNYKLMDCKQFLQNFIVPNDIDYITIECSSTSNKSNVFYKDGMSFIQERAHVNDKILNSSKAGRRFGILLFGIDTLSQFNFRRVMPKTFEYVQNNSWFELSGYNKGADFDEKYSFWCNEDDAKAQF